MPIWFIDYYYIILVLPAILFAAWAQFRVSSTFKRYSQVCTRRGMTGAEAANAVLRQAGVNGVRIERVSGKLTDHYDPRDGVIRLSDEVYDRATVAAVGVAAHEAGHAVQYHSEYAPMRVRQAILPVTKISSNLAIPLIFIGFLLGVAEGTFGRTVAVIGILLFAAATLFQLVTLPVEFNASKRAMKQLEDGHLLNGDELQGSRKVLTAAALTYVAALLVSLMQLLRLVALLGRSNRR